MFITSYAYAWNQNPPRPIDACARETIGGIPSVLPNFVAICRTAYSVLYDPQAKIPLWVAYSLTPNHTDGCVVRSNAFDPDASLQKGNRAELSDYSHSGYDIGHLANDADMSWDATVERESFILTNMSPQRPKVNRGTWKKLESDVRDWAFVRKHTLTIYDGNIYNSKSLTIGSDKVVVPDFLYKIVVDTVTHETIAVIMPNLDTINQNVEPYIVSIADVEKATNVTFPIVGDKTQKATALWPIDLKALSTDKKSICQKN